MHAELLGVKVEPQNAVGRKEKGMYCQKCRQQIPDGSQFCTQCGGQQKVGGIASLAPADETKNPLAVWGFVCAVVGLFLPIIVIDLLFSAAGTVMSGIGAQKTKLRGLAIAGIVIGAIGVIGALMLLVTEPEFYFDIWDS